MVRTKDTAGVKVAGAKASRKAPPPAPVASSSGGESSASKNKYAGGNPYCPRETPAWQKPITQFFGSAPTKSCGPSSSEGCSSGSSSSTSTAAVSQGPSGSGED